MNAAHYPVLDGLRGVAALMVAYGHAGYFGWVPLVVGLASIGVVLFFFLSGFLMGHHYLPPDWPARPVRRRLVYWLAFLARRFVRVYPPYVLAPVVGYLLLMPAMPPDFETTQPFAEVAFGKEIVDILLFRGELGIYWTIKQELWFYLLFPLLIATFVLFRRRLWVVGAVLVALLLLNHVYHGLHRSPGYMALFVAGTFTSLVTKAYPRAFEGRRRANAATLGAMVAFVGLIAAISRSSPTQDSIWKLDWVFAGLFFLMFAALVKSDGVIVKVLASRPATAIGQASYSLYLVHIIAYYLAIRLFGGGGIAALATLAVVTLAYYRAVERWFVLASKRVSVKRWIRA